MSARIRWRERSSSSTGPLQKDGIQMWPMSRIKKCKLKLVAAPALSTTQLRFESIPDLRICCGHRFALSAVVERFYLSPPITLGYHLFGGDYVYPWEVLKQDSNFDIV